MKYMKYFIIGVSILIILLLGGIVNLWFQNNSQDFNPQNLCEEKLGFNLPSSAQITNEDYFDGQYYEEIYGIDLLNDYWEEYYFAKISFEKKDYNYIKKNLSQRHNTKLTKEDYFVSLFFGEKEVGGDLKVGLIRYCSWWDIKENEIKIAYEKITAGKTAKTKVLYTFVTKDKQGDYYLYIAY